MHDGPDAEINNMNNISLDEARAQFDERCLLF